MLRKVTILMLLTVLAMPMLFTASSDSSTSTFYFVLVPNASAYSPKVWFSSSYDGNSQIEGSWQISNSGIAYYVAMEHGAASNAQLTISFTPFTSGQNSVDYGITVWSMADNSNLASSNSVVAKPSLAVKGSGTSIRDIFGIEYDIPSSLAAGNYESTVKVSVEAVV